MEFLDRIVEDRILEAQKEGLFDDLPGKGKPLQFDDDTFVPEDFRLSFKILKNAKCLPPELEIRAEIYSLRQLLNSTLDEKQRLKATRDLNYRILQLNLIRSGKKECGGRTFWR